MPLFWTILLIMMVCLIKSYNGQKIDYFHPTCSGADNELSVLRGIVKEQDKKVEKLEKELNIFKKIVSDMRGTIQELPSKQGTMAEKLNHGVGFTAMLRGDTSIYQLEENEKLVFGYVSINEGNAYNKDSGIFRCPRNGLYAFYVNILTLRHKTAEVEITKNGNHTNSAAYSQGVSEGTNGSIFALLTLTVGDEVWLRAANNWSSTGKILKYRENTFSGFLVHQY
ncbi:complement C1q-like protein 4 [Saccostrea cucullata]|uniref:complement C1q-like protein 4 n=1 Tax=Saccostrea cuccullata TaxID=36930 RepID=UPI002ED546BA